MRSLLFLFLSLPFFFIFLLPGVSYSQTLTLDQFSGSSDVEINSENNDGFVYGKWGDVADDQKTGKKIYVWREADDHLSSTDMDIFFALYDQDMTLLSAPYVRVNTVNYIGDQDAPRVAVNQSDGTFVVVWESNTQGSYDIYIKKYDLSGNALTGEILVNTQYTTGRQIDPLLCIDERRGEVNVAWIDADGRDDQNIANDFGAYMRALSYEDLSPVTDETRVNLDTVGSQSPNDLKISPITGELFTVCHSAGYVSGYDIVLRKFVRSGSAFQGSAETVVNTTHSSYSGGASIAINPLTGNYLISYGLGFTTGNGWECFFRAFDRFDNSLLDETQINQTLPQNQINPIAVWDLSSGYITFFYYWSCSSLCDIRYQVFTPDFAPQGSEGLVMGTSWDLKNTWAGFRGHYDDLNQKVLLAYSDYSYNGSPNARTWFTELSYTPPAAPTCTTSVSSNYNYVEKVVPLTEVTDETFLSSPSVQTIVTRQYFDGLQRPIQTVLVGASPQKMDLVQPYEYDSYGNRPKNYLPYAASCSGGDFHSDYATEQADFYANAANNNADKIVNDNTPFHTTTFESSPLNRVTIQGDVGDAFSQKTVTRSYNSNVGGEVRQWTFSTDMSASGSSFYPANTLFKTQTVDEEGFQVYTYTNMDGRTVYTQKTDGGDTLDTYYIYDDLGHLRIVIPPAAVDLLSGQSYEVSYSSNFFNDWLYGYFYDQRGRLIQKKSPGAGEQVFVYDVRNRLVLSQDSVQYTTNTYTFYKYDAMDRKVIEGEYTDSRTLSVIRDGITNQGVLYETRSSSSDGYTNDCLPSSGTHYLTYFYDDYDFNSDGINDYSYQTSGLTPEPQPYSYVKGKLTGVWDICPENYTKLIKVVFYDRYGRSVQVQENNLITPDPTTLPQTTMVLDFGGRLLSSLETSDMDGEITTLRKDYTYDQVGRPLQQFVQVNGQSRVTAHTFKYNELGQLVEDNLHKTASGYLQSVDYTYHIRGWITHINNSQLDNSNGVDNNDDTGDLFGLQLLYEATDSEVGNTARYDGLITGMRFQTTNTGGEGFWKYSYDNFKRLSYALYGVYDTSTGTVNYGYNSEEFGYDKNGNISSLVRRSGSEEIDNLNYTYTGNQLKTVSEYSSPYADQGFVDGANQSTEYTFDANGNMLTDLNKGIQVTYNSRNLPIKVFFPATGNEIDYEYTYSGRKLTKTIRQNGSAISERWYIGSFEYSYDGSNPVALNLIHFKGGRIEPDGTGGFDFQYDLKDHLGNIYVSFDENPDTAGKARVIQEQHYLPSGFRRAIYQYGTQEDYLFNGKELQADFGLEWYDYGARFYDPILMRWHAQDPMTDMMPGSSPYSYVYNNPVNLIDIDGMWPWDNLTVKGRKQIYQRRKQKGKWTRYDNLGNVRPKQSNPKYVTKNVRMKFDVHLHNKEGKGGGSEVNWPSATGDIKSVRRKSEENLKDNTIKVEKVRGKSTTTHVYTDVQNDGGGTPTERPVDLGKTYDVEQDDDKILLQKNGKKSPDMRDITWHHNTSHGTDEGYARPFKTMVSVEIEAAELSAKFRVTIYRRSGTWKFGSSTSGSTLHSGKWRSFVF